MPCYSQVVKSLSTMQYNSYFIYSRAKKAIGIGKYRYPDTPEYSPGKHGIEA
jgi:hypothetical protein